MTVKYVGILEKELIDLRIESFHLTSRRPYRCFSALGNKLSSFLNISHCYCLGTPTCPPWKHYMQSPNMNKRNSFQLFRLTSSIKYFLLRQKAFYLFVVQGPETYPDVQHSLKAIFLLFGDVLVAAPRTNFSFFIFSVQILRLLEYGNPTSQR